MRVWLPGDDDHPPRPNVPIVRHLTYDEIHAFQLGLVGLPVGAAFVLDAAEIALWFTIALMGIVFGVSHLEETNGARQATGVIAEEPWYFLSGYFLFIAVGAWSATTFIPPPPIPDALSALYPSLTVAATMFTLAYLSDEESNLG